MWLLALCLRNISQLALLGLGLQELSTFVSRSWFGCLVRRRYFSLALVLQCLFGLVVFERIIVGLGILWTFAFVLQVRVVAHLSEVIVEHCLFLFLAWSLLPIISCHRLRFLFVAEQRVQ